jgi:hypothetical protein
MLWSVIAGFAAYYMPNTAHVSSNFETRAEPRVVQSLDEINWDLPLFLPRLKYFDDLSLYFSASYMPNVADVSYNAETRTKPRKMHSVEEIDRDVLLFLTRVWYFDALSSGMLHFTC